MEIRLAARIKNLPPYLFAEIDRLKAERRKRGVDLIDLGIGDPDQPTPRHIVEALQKAAADAANHQYPSYEGMPRFREAAAGWMKRREFPARLRQSGGRRPGPVAGIPSL
jgi:LL-diaminopimelate aminotransferase